MAARTTRAARLGHVVTLVAASLWAAPVLLLFVGSLRPRGLPPPGGLELWPADASFGAYRLVFELLPVTSWAKNSALVVLFALPLTIVVASLAGFGIRLLRPRLRRAAIAGIVVLLAIPTTAVWATRLEIYKALSISDTLLALIAPALLATTPFHVLVYVFAYHRISDEVLDAGAVDGAGPIRLWWSIGLPNVRAATVAVATLSFAWHWGNFLDPLLYLADPKLTTLPLGLSLLQQLNPTDFPLLLAGAAIVALPPVLVLLWGQRTFLDTAAWTRT